MKKYNIGDLTAEALLEMVQEVNCWDGSLDWLGYYENDEEFFDLYFEGRPMDAVRAASYGDYRYMDAYVRFNGYANLESASWWAMEEELLGAAEEIAGRYMELVEAGHIEDYAGASMESEEVQHGNRLA